MNVIVPSEVTAEDVADSLAGVALRLVPDVDGDARAAYDEAMARRYPVSDG